jgi:UDP-N-acetylmuramoyl-L-alanyl-D-glutamate--2,6-diaminopimelate ligase
MGEAAARASDFTVATSDNPRSEDPMAILRDVEPGLKRAGGVEGKTYRMIPDRREAIRVALEMARQRHRIGSKGHETYQIIGNER